MSVADKTYFIVSQTEKKKNISLPFYIVIWQQKYFSMQIENFRGQFFFFLSEIRFTSTGMGGMGPMYF